MKLNPVVREDFAFLRWRAWAPAPLWLLAAAVSWSLTDDQFHATTVWGQLGLVVAVVAGSSTGPRRGTMIYVTTYLAYLLTHGVRHGFGW